MSPNLNFIFMMADSLGYGDVGFNGNTIINTSNLDQLCTEGARCTRFFAASPVCSPSRASFLTGRSALRLGISNPNQGFLPGNEITLAQIAKDKGYLTGFFGKWHLGTLNPDSSSARRPNPARDYAPPWERSYDVSFASEQDVPTWDPGRDYDFKTMNRSDKPYIDPYYFNGSKVDNIPNGCNSRLVADYVEQFISQAHRDERPFMATIWFHAPHAPVEAGPEFLELYKGQELSAAHYYGVITALDVQVGRINRMIKEMGIETNTVFVFCSDHGPDVCTPEGRQRRHYGSTGGLRGGKWGLYNGGLCVPAIIKWPGLIEPGMIINTPCSMLDVVPTFAEAVGYTFPDSRPIDGVSLLPMLRGEGQIRPRPIPFRFRDTRLNMSGSPMWALVGDRYKLLTNVSPDGIGDQLYDLDGDMAETRNIIHLHRELTDDYRRQIVAFKKSIQQSRDGLDYPRCKPADDSLDDLSGCYLNYGPGRIYVTPRDPQVVLVNGPSSAGKTTFCREFIEMARPVYVFRDLGLFCSCVSSRVRQDFFFAKDIMRAADHAVIAQGFGIVIEVIAKNIGEWDDLLSRYGRYRLLTIEITADAEVCRSRERERAARRERPLGFSDRTRLAISQDIRYDLNLDSSQMTASELAKKANEFISLQDDGMYRQHR